MKKTHLIIIVIVLIGLVAVLTNPNQDRHKEVVKNKLNLYLQKSIKEEFADRNNEGEKSGQAIGTMLGVVLVNQIIDNLVSTDNYVLFSKTKITWDGKTKVIGIGAFGNVYLTAKLDDSLNEGLLNNK